MTYFILKITGAILWLFSIASLIATLPIALFLLMPTVIVLSQIVILLPDPRFILLFSFASALAYSLISCPLRQQFEHRKVNWDIKYNYSSIGLSLLTSYFFWNGFSIINKFGLLSLVLLCILQFFFYKIYFKVIEDGYLLIKNFFLVISKTNIVDFCVAYRKSIFIVFTFAVLLVSTLGSLYIMFEVPVKKALAEAVKKKTIESRTPHIIDIQPFVTYHMTKVVIKGDNFGWLNRPTDINSRLLLNGRQKITADLWTDTEIVFTIPMDWKLGEHTVTIEKYIEYGGVFLRRGSNKAKFVILSATDGWGHDDDLYFEQLKSLDKKVLKLNGYN